jgi:hypothetical protein
MESIRSSHSRPKSSWPSVVCVSLDGPPITAVELESKLSRTSTGSLSLGSLELENFVDHPTQALQDFSILTNIVATELVHQLSQLTKCLPNYVRGAIQG